MESEYRLPDAAHMGRVYLEVQSLSQALDFYEGVLGLHVRTEAAGTVTLAASAGRPALLKLRERANTTARRTRVPGLFHFALLVPTRPDLARTLRRLAEQRWPLQGASDHLVSEALYLADPDGHGIEVYADRPRATWTQDNGELRMATLPLDLEALLREADDEPWHGIPPDTTMGHVHLHVSDLATAGSFYRGVLGFDVTARGYPGALFLSAGGYHHHLGVNTWAPPRGDADSLGLVDYQIILLQAALPTLLDRLRANEWTPEAVDGGWRVRDPDGLAVVLVGDTV